MGMNGYCHSALVFSASALAAISAAPAPVVTQTPAVTATLKWPGRIPANSVVFSPDGKTVVTTCSDSSDRSVKFWEVETGKCVMTIKNPHEVNYQQHQRGHAYVAAFSPDGKTLATGGDDHTVRLWDVKTGKSKGVLRGETPIYSTGSLAFSRDGKTLFSGGIDVRYWDVVNLKEISSVKIRGSTTPKVGFDSEGKALALVGEPDAPESVGVYDAQTGKKEFILEGRKLEASCMLFRPDGKAVVIAGRGDHTIRTWSLATGKQLTSLKLPRARVCEVAFSRDGKVMAIGYIHQKEDGKTDSHPQVASVKLFDSETGSELWTLEGKTNPIGPLAFAPNGTTLAAGLLRQPTIQFWKLPTKGK
jgi:WD40 repeat protein